jgi:organic hydroperoxide reductase OsmC/OhrA
MLTFLALAAKRKFVPDSYLDDAVGYLEKNGQGRMAVTRVVLRPRITWAEGTSVSEEDLNKLHHQAHEGCFIANSVTTDVRVESVL